jgi:hypothetical protein
MIIICKLKLYIIAQYIKSLNLIILLDQLIIGNRQ